MKEWISLFRQKYMLNYYYKIRIKMESFLNFGFCKKDLVAWDTLRYKNGSERYHGKDNNIKFFSGKHHSIEICKNRNNFTWFMNFSVQNVKVFAEFKKSGKGNYSLYPFKTTNTDVYLVFFFIFFLQLILGKAINLFKLLLG